MKIKKISKIDRNNEDVYNIEVEDNHNYYCNDILVSNCHSLRSPKEAKSVIGLIEKTKNAQYRLGLTGTLRDGAINKFQIQGMFGSIYESTTTKALMDRGILTPLKIKNIRIKYPDNITKDLNGLEWDDQQNFIESEENPRQLLICDLAKTLPDNTLILFRKIDHGNFIYDYLLANTSKKVEYIDGQVNAEDREKIRKDMENKSGMILVASFGTFSEGISVKNLHNIIFASSYKSKIKIMQSIGRSLRLHNSKKSATLYDFSDDFGHMKKHSEHRTAMYEAEQFSVKEVQVNLADWCNNKGIQVF